MTRVLCRASAGTGKTHRVCEEVAARVGAGLDPAHIIGVTFTTKAAGELKARVQQRLLDDAQRPVAERVARAERLELAALGTVHAVAYRLLQRYALRLGLSPDLEVLDEERSERFLDEVLLTMPAAPWEELVAAGRRLGLANPQGVARALLDLQRSNRLPDDAVRLGLARGAARVGELLGGPDPAAGSLDDLYRRLGEAADRMPADGTDKTEKARAALQKLGSKRSGQWGDAVRARKIEAAVRTDPFLGDLRAFAARVLQHPELHDDLRRYAALLAAQTAALRDAYERRKEEHGLLDFADLEARLLDLLEREDVAADLRAGFSLVVVDEFQDTNPMQLAIFVRLHDILGDSYWVGDEKQAIYGFRGTDSELMEVVWAGGDEAVHGAQLGAPDLLAGALGREGDRTEALGANRRSQAGLVAFFNALFERVFGAEARVEAVREARPGGVERWRLAATSFEGEAEALAEGLLALKAEGVAFRDVAVLARTNRRVQGLGERLRARGVPVVTPVPGLLAAREAAVAVAGLRVAVDGWDSLACAQVLHLLADQGQGTPRWLEDRLRARADGDGGPPFPEEAVLQRLRALPDHLPPSDALAAVLVALDLPARIAAWGSPARRAANLDALLALAREREAQALAQGRGFSAAGLLADLDRLADEEEDTLPVPHGVDAVTVLTYHGSKGLEWPVVVLTDLDTAPKPDAFRARATGGKPREGKPLEGRELHAWIWPFGTDDGPHPKRVGDSGLDDAALTTPEGQAIVRAEEQEAKRLLYVGMTRARDKLVLAHRWNEKKGEAKCQWLAAFDVDRLVPPDAPEGEHPLPGCPTTARVRELRPPAVPRVAPATPGVWFAERAHPLRPLPARVRNPSAEVAVPGVALGEPQSIGPRLRVGRVRDEAEYEALGSAVHAYLASLPSLDGADEAARVRVAQRCLDGFGVQGLLQAADLVAAGERLKAWAAKHYPGATWHTEVPVTGPAGDGAQWVGVADLLLVNPDGSVVVVDHKGATVPEALDDARQAAFAAQVGAYRGILEDEGRRVAGAFLHLPLGGAVLPVDVTAEPPGLAGGR